MTIIFYYYYGTGGALANIRNLLDSYASSYPEDKIVIVAHRDNEELHRLSCHKNVESVRCGKGGGDKELVRLKLGFGGLNKIAKEHKADVIWSLNLGSYIGTRIPQLLAVNNPFQVYPREVLRVHPQSTIRTRLLRLFFHLTLRSSSAVLLQTHLMKKYIDDLGYRNLKSFVVSKAVEYGAPSQNEDERIAKIELLAKGGVKLPIYIATAYPHKNHLVLLKAMERIVTSTSSRSTTLLVSLTKDEIVNIYPKAEQLIESGNILPLGWIATSDLERFYRLSDIVLVPSKLESLSSTHIEALMWQKPIISSDMPFSRDLCDTASLYVDPDNDKAWAEEITMLLNDQDKQKQLIKLGEKRQHVYHRNWREVVERIRSVLRDTVGRGEPT